MRVLWGKVCFWCFVVGFTGNSLLSGDIGIEATVTRLASSANSFDTRTGSRSSAKSSSSIFSDTDLSDYEDDLVAKKPRGHIDVTVDTHSKLNSDEGCPQRCTCGLQFDRIGGKERKFVVNCTDSSQDVKVLQHLPDNVEHLIFVGNVIPTLPVNIFGNRNYTKLKVIDMSRNQITEIKGKAFHHVNNVESLILNFNKISSESIQNHPRVFSNFYNLKELRLTAAFDRDLMIMSDLAQIFDESNLTKLERIHIEQNNIDTISNASVFCELPSLLSLRIAQNKLTDLNINVSCLKHLYYIDASYNQITTVDPSSGLAKLLEEYSTRSEFLIELAGNPFSCDCNLKYFLDWIKKWEEQSVDRIPHRKSLECETGLPKENENLLLINVEHLECPAVKASEYSSSAAAAISWVIGVIALLVVATVVYSNRIVIFRKVTPLLQNTPQGVKYTSIERNEEAEIAHV